MIWFLKESREAKIIRLAALLKQFFHASTPREIGLTIFYAGDQRFRETVANTPFCYYIHNANTFDREDITTIFDQLDDIRTQMERMKKRALRQLQRVGDTSRWEAEMACMVAGINIWTVSIGYLIEKSIYGELCAIWNRIRSSEQYIIDAIIRLQRQRQNMILLGFSDSGQSLLSMKQETILYWCCYTPPWIEELLFQKE